MLAGFRNSFAKLNKYFMLLRLVMAQSLLAMLLLPIFAVATPLAQQAAAASIQTAVNPKGILQNATNPQQMLNLAVALKIQNSGQLNSFLTDLYNPSSPQYHQYLTAQQFTDKFIGNTVRQQVRDYLTQAGLTVNDSGLGSVVNVSGTVAQVEATFNIHISNYKDKNGRSFYSNDVTPALPTNIAKDIQYIGGLSNSERLRSQMSVQDRSIQPNANTGTPQGCSDAVNYANAYGSFTPNQIATAYNFNGFYTANNYGQGQAIALVELDDYNDSDIAAYQNCFGTAIPVKRVLVDGGTSIGDGEDEVELDIEVITGMATKLSSLLVYEAHNDLGSLLDEYQKIANDNLAPVVSTSWGGCEANTAGDFIQAENTVLQQMAAQGQSVFAAAGDDGSEGCGNSTISAEDPASQPYVTGVGGTQLIINGDNSYKQETVWNEYNRVDLLGRRGGAGGGGISTIWTQPTYQNGTGTVNAYSNRHREVPDVSADADPYTGYTVYIKGSFEAAAGTSAAAPLWAAAAGLTNNYLASKNLSYLGFANPLIYGIFKAYPGAALHDVTMGDNCYDSSCGTPDSGSGTYPATTGYDQATGTGSFDAATFAKDAAAFPPAGTYVYNLPLLANQAYNFTSYLAIQNAGNATANISIIYYGNDGTLTASDADCPTLQVRAECLPSNLFASGSLGQGSVVSSQPLNVIVSEATPYGGAAYAVSSGSSNNLVAPFAINNYYGFNTLYSIFNVGAAATTVTVSYYNQDGTPVSNATQTVNIAGHGSTIVNQAATNSGLPASFYGTALISAPAGSQLAAQVLESNVGTHFTAIANAQPLSNAQTTLYAPAIFNDAFGFSTGSNIVNPSNSSVTVNVTYYDDSGTTYAAPAFQLAGNAVQPIFQGASGGTGLPSTGLPDQFSGSAVVTASGPVMMVVNEAGGSGSKSGVYAAAASGGSNVGLPVLANGGYGYTTGTTVLNTSNNSISGSIQYYDLTGKAIGSSQPFNIGPHASQLLYQGAAGLPQGFYGTAVVSTNSGNNLITTTNAQSANFFYTYSEPNS